MKKENRHIDIEIENIIQSGIKSKNVKTSAFFTTRVVGRVEQLENKNIFFNRFSMILKPAFVLIVLINVFNYFVYNSSSSLNNNEKSYESVISEYKSVQSDFILSDDLLTGN